MENTRVNQPIVRRRVRPRVGSMPVAIAAVASVLLGAIGAHAASSISTGLIFVGDGQRRSCRATNISDKKTLTDVRTTMYRSDGTQIASSGCGAVAPFASCGNFSATTPGPGFIWCQATSKQGKKFLRATLSNETTGERAYAH